ncbi:cytochrome c oxidase assembly protein cox15 [Grosmannia clavigera kw1407]|uniref:Cytochrome c oxidase assembly protein cox15 n=1 Tax=Grosmannia clavigera (strain kw1407 / UAMH 11150) TaxID=655863 RepID=F0X988_GROCL|nr:cytochrome c oxidase assembly protein cox15 [Grosmannia clavigera kw1407]EFX05297.1 cytochrome c oxidase assembly protein cox15 [Grosmannia clavigera kw1407]
MALFESALRRTAVLVARVPVSCSKGLRNEQMPQLSQMLRQLSQPSPFQSRFKSTIAVPVRRPNSRAASMSPGFFAQAERATCLSRSLATVFATASPATTTTAASSTGPDKEGFFPETSSKAVAYWLIGSAISVFGIVVWGGLTRLTESGLSITEWRPVTGALPPRSEAEWEAEFTRYRASPEYARLNPHMTLDEFKKIYFMEWSHRLWGRLIGLTFVAPALYFVLRRRVAKPMAWQLFGIAALIGFQGFIGWWMVSSGLREELFAPGAHPPRVSQYRLTTHLATAFVCYSWMMLAGLAVLRDIRLRADPAAGARLASVLALPALQPFRRSVAVLTALIFVTAMSGALVAGLDAGLIYNEFPMMGVGLTPPKDELWDPHYARKADHADLWWRNMLENPSLVQLDHRILATTTFCSVLALFAYARRGNVAALLPSNIKRGTTGLVHLVLLQVTLGIATLIYMVPTHLAATHQAGSLALLTGALVLAHRLRIPKSSLRIIQRQLETASKASKP